MVVPLMGLLSSSKTPAPGLLSDIYGHKSQSQTFPPVLLHPYQSLGKYFVCHFKNTLGVNNKHGDIKHDGKLCVVAVKLKA